jgi:hypothetical protein
VPVLVAHLDEPVDVRGHLGLQRRSQHPWRAPSRTSSSSNDTRSGRSRTLSTASDIGTRV